MVERQLSAYSAGQDHSSSKRSFEREYGRVVNQTYSGRTCGTVNGSATLQGDIQVMVSFCNEKGIES